MRKKILFPVFCLIFIFINCQNTKPTDKATINKKTVIKVDENCTLFYKKYQRKIVLEENDSALIYIDKAIECDSKNNTFKYSKVSFLISIQNYEGAIISLKPLLEVSSDPSLKMQKAVLKLKIKQDGYENLLKECQKEFSEIDVPTLSNELYKVALLNYFESKSSALKKTTLLKEKWNAKNEYQNIVAIEQLIETKNREEVLFSLYNIQ